MLELTGESSLLTSRLLKRAEIENRADDNEETIHARLEVYRAQTAPLISHYGEAGLLESVDGMQEPDKVFADIMAIIMGHMHHHLRGGGYRRRIDFWNKTPVVNAAVVPRIIKKGVITTRQHSGDLKEKKVFQTHHHFMELELNESQNSVKEVRDLWVCKGNRNSKGTKFLIWRQS